MVDIDVELGDVKLRAVTILFGIDTASCPRLMLPMSLATGTTPAVHKTVPNRREYIHQAVMNNPVRVERQAIDEPQLRIK